MRKKLITGLVGLLIGIGSVGCQSTMNGEVGRFTRCSNQISKILGLDSGDSYRVSETQKKGDPISIRVYGLDGKLKKMIRYEDNFYNDGVYDTKTKITIEGELKIMPLPKGNYERRNDSQLLRA